MLSFKTRSYFEGIWNAIRGVDFVPRMWDIWDTEELIYRIVYKASTEVLEECHESNFWYNDMMQLNALTQFILSSDTTVEEQEKCEKEFRELIGKMLPHLCI